MKIACAQLQTHLRHPARVYLIAGDEPFLAQEAASLIREAARLAGHSERIRIATDQSEWLNDLTAATRTLSLLSDKRLIEADLRTVRLTPAHTKTLTDVINTCPRDVMLLLLAKRPDSRSGPPAWHTACEKQGVLVPVWPVKADQLPQWIIQRAKSLQIPLSVASAQWLAEQTEGNLSATAQELEKLLLWQTDTPLSAEAVDQSLREMIKSSARYDIFQLTDALDAKDSRRALKILSGLFLCGTEPALILWAFTRTLRTMAKRNRHSAKTASALLPMAAQMDKMIKGAAKGRFRDEAESLLLMITGAIPWVSV